MISSIFQQKFYVFTPKAAYETSNEHCKISNLFLCHYSLKLDLSKQKIVKIYIQI